VGRLQVVDRRVQQGVQRGLAEIDRRRPLRRGADRRCRLTGPRVEPVLGARRVDVLRHVDQLDAVQANDDHPGRDAVRLRNAVRVDVGDDDPVALDGHADARVPAAERERADAEEDGHRRDRHRGAVAPIQIHVATVAGRRDDPIREIP
jgi:hypothetical protein